MCVFRITNALVFYKHMFDWKQHLKESTCLKYGAKTQRSATSPFTVSAHLTRNIHPYESNNELPRRFLSALVRILNHKRLGICWKKPQFQALHFHLGPHVAVFCNSVGASSCTSNEHQWMITENHWNHWMITAIAWWLIVVGHSFQITRFYPSKSHIYFTHHPPFSGLHPLEEFSISSLLLGSATPMSRIEATPTPKELKRL